MAGRKQEGPATSRQPSGPEKRERGIRSLVAKGGERVRVVHILSDSVPQTVRFTVSGTAQPDAPVRGLVEVERAGPFGRREPETLPLGAENSLRKGFWDIAYSVYVTPREDVEIRVHSRHFRSKWLFAALVAVLLAGVAAGLLPLLFARG